MPIRLETPMLSVDVDKLRELDTRNAEHLFGLYSMFSKCAESMEDGRRLENLTWRLWNRETLCCEPQPQHNHTTTPTIDFARSRPSRRDVPGLSASVESLVSIRSDSSEEAQQQSTASCSTHANTSPKSESTLSRSRGKEKHITSLGLEKMVHSIQDKQEIAPLSPSIADAMPPLPKMPPSTDITPRAVSPTLNAPFRSSDSSSSTAPLTSPESDKSAQQTVDSDTSADVPSSHSVIRGFSRDKASFYRSHTHLAPEAIPMKHNLTKSENASKKDAVFMLGGGSSGDDDSSFDDKMASLPRQSSLTLGLKRPSGNKKTLSFRDEVESRALENKSHEDEEVFESDEEDESAIDDDSEQEEGEEDDDDWEDDASESAENPANDKPLFQRVDSQPNLVSRRSVLTTELHQLDRAATFANLASKSTPMIKRTKTSTSSGPSDDDRVPPVDDPSLAVLPGHMTRSKPIVMTARNAQQMAFSPRTTRRMMISTEMTESLRTNVLWERRQKKSTTNAMIKRRHTAQTLTNLQDYPGEAAKVLKPGSRNTSFDHYFEAGLGEYHRSGW